jgi:hypothetical protein
VAQDEGNALWSAEVGEPIPGEEAFDANDEVLPVGGNGLEKWLRCCLHIPVQKDLSAAVEDTDVHGPSVQVDATVKLVRRRIESPEVSSFRA